MRRRQGSLLTVVALCLGGALTACGGGQGEGYAAVGAGSSPKGAVKPSGAVTLIPLDGASPSASGTTSSTSSPSPRPGRPPGATPAPPAGAPDGGTDTDTASGTASGTSRPGTAPGTPATVPPRTATAPPPGTTPPPPPPSPVPRPPATPATLTLSAPVLADADKRWCERVTLTFRNTGGTAATSGTVTFATHIIGALGVDWATIESTQPLPTPLAAGTTKTRTYTVCVDSWRVPLGMHVDTRKVTATWK